jgi:hypothetical protein
MRSHQVVQKALQSSPWQRRNVDAGPSTEASEPPKLIGKQMLNKHTSILDTLWLYNIAMENGP